MARIVLVHGAFGGAWVWIRREMLEIDADHSCRLSATDELVAALDRLALGAAEPVAAGAGACSRSPGPCPTRGAR
jgi:hypothetical protein